jgi:lysophospholipase L1-like esterase
MKKNRFLNILLTIVSLIIVFVVVEIGFRIYANYVTIYDIEMHKYAKKIKRRSDVSGLSHEHIPNSEAELMNVNVKINNLGFRDDDISEEIDTNEFRTLVIGSSITLGWGVPFDSVFTSLLERKLNEDNTDIRNNVINSANGNYNTYMEYLYFRKILPIVKPNMVILHYFINDAEIISPKSANFFIKNSYLIAYLYVRVKQVFHAKQNNYSSIGEYYKELYQESSPGFTIAKDAIKDMKQLCDDRKIEFLVLVQPDLHDISESSDQVECYNIVGNFLEDNNIEFIDLSVPYRDAFGDYPHDIWVNDDDSHPNAKGHFVIYDELNKYLLQKKENSNKQN